nr:hypothetical protein BCU00_01540 [Vibrio breoganii]
MHPKILLGWLPVFIMMTRCLYSLFLVKSMGRVIPECFSGPAHWSGVCFYAMQLKRSPIKHFGDDEGKESTPTYPSFPSAPIGNLFLRNATKKVPDENIGDFECRIAKT